MEFVCTGFGMFRGVPDNPTSHLVPLLRERLKSVPNVALVESDVLEVSSLAVLRFLKRMEASVGQRDVTFVHLGVAASRSVVSIERFCYNTCQFSMAPDEQGWAPDNVQIDPKAPLDERRESRLPLQAVLEATQRRFPGLVEMSDDPGRYLCNYIYFQNARRGRRCVFVHVPPFEAVPKEVQLEIVACIVGELAKNATAAAAAAAAAAPP